MLNVENFRFDYDIRFTIRAIECTLYALKYSHYDIYFTIYASRVKSLAIRFTLHALRYVTLYDIHAFTLPAPIALKNKGINNSFNLRAKTYLIFNT